MKFCFISERGPNKDCEMLMLVYGVFVTFKTESFQKPVGSSDDDHSENIQ